MGSNYFNYHFKLGYCWCGCGTEIPIKRKGRNELQKYVSQHQHKGKYGKLAPGYKTGITEDKSRGYATIIRRHHKYADKRGRVYLHRYLKELDLSRYITPEYDVHHKDGNTRNNEPDNLMEILKSEHTILGNVKDMNGRTCILCKIKYEERLESNKRQWYRYKKGYICGACNMKIYKV